MSQYKYAEIADTVYFWFAANDTTGTAADGTTPLYDVRLAGAASNAAATASGTPTLLSSTDYPNGIYEIAIDTTGYAAGEYAVFCTLTVSTVNPAGFCGSFKLRTAGTAALKTETVSIAANAITATSINDGAITDAKVADDVKVTLRDGAHGGSSASFAFGAGGTISNSNGHALNLSSTGGNGSGLICNGFGTGSGITAAGNGGGTGHGVYFVGSPTGHGAYFLGNTTGNGLTAMGGAGLVSHGIHAGSSGTTAVGFYADQGAVITKDGGVGLLVSSTTSGNAMEVNGVSGDIVGDITGSLSGAVTLPSIPANWITDAGIDTTAITEIQAGLATSAQVAGIGSSGGAAINVDATTDNSAGGITGVTSGTTKTGTQTGTFANTSILDGTYHSIAHQTNVIDWVYQFLTGAGTMPISVTWTGYFNPITKTMTVEAWNHVGGAWEVIGTIAGQTGSTNVVKNLVLYSRHRGTSTAELGKVYLRFVTSDGTTLATDQVYISYAMTARGSYSDGAVWLNTNASNTNTQSYVDGVPENPVSTIAAALTIATALNLKRVRVANGSIVTLAASFANRTMMGHGFSLALGGQDVSGAYFEGVENIQGTGVISTGEAIFQDCHTTNVTIGECDFVRCHHQGTVTLSQASVPYRFHDCAGISSAVIEFGAATQTVVMSKMSGNWTITGMDSGDTLYCDGEGVLTIDNTTCTGGTAYISGAIKLIGGTGGTTISDSARWDEGQNITNVTGTVNALNTQAKADVNAEVVDVLRTDTIPDSYSTDGSQPTIAQALLEVRQFMMEKAISSTTMTVKKPDGSTTAMTFTLNDDTAPTSITRAS